MLVQLYSRLYYEATYQVGRDQFSLLNPYCIIGSLGCLLWIVTYALVIRDGVRNKTYGIPMGAICLNFTWEILGSFVWTNPIPLWLGFDRLWLLVDVAIVAQLLYYGRQRQPLHVVQTFFYPIVGIALALGLCGQWSFTESYYDPLGIIVAFMINLVMSILFVLRFCVQHERGDLRGLSYPAAWTKMTGTLGTAVLNYYLIPVTHPKMESYVFMYFLYVAIFLFDCFYIYLLWRARRSAVSAGAPGSSKEAPAAMAASTSPT